MIIPGINADTILKEDRLGCLGGGDRLGLRADVLNFGPRQFGDK